MDTKYKTLNDMIVEMKKLEQAMADYKASVKDIIASNIGEDVYAALEQYDLDTINEISRSMFKDVGKYAQQAEKKTNTVAETVISAVDTGISAAGNNGISFDDILNIGSVKV